MSVGRVSGGRTLGGPVSGGRASKGRASGAAVRPGREPRWKSARRLLPASAGFEGPSGASSWLPAVPGTRLARGVRRGSPAAVTPLTAGARTVSAARRPSSLGGVHADGAWYGLAD